MKNKTNNLNRTRKVGEVAGSAAIALSFFAGALALNSDTKAHQFDSAATRFEQESGMDAEGGLQNLADGPAGLAKDAHSHASDQRMNRDVYGTVAGLEMLAGVALLGVVAGMDSKRRRAERADAATAADIPGEGMLPFDDMTQRIHTAIIPVPRTEATGVAKHRAS